MVYIHSVGSVGRREDETLDVKASWKAISAKMIRRTDRFIQLALLGAYDALKERDVLSDTALYMASGQGNLAVFKRLRDQRYIQKQPPKPVDFINSLSNTAGFYVAQYFELTGKNLNISRQSLSIETLLLLAQNDLALKRESYILLGGVDELQEPVAFTQKTLGVCDATPLGEGSNWLLLSSEKMGAKASLVVSKKRLDRDSLLTRLEREEATTFVSFGYHCKAEDVSAIKALKPFQVFEVKEGYHETVAAAYCTHFVTKQKGRLIYIDADKNGYTVIEIETL